MGLGCVVFYVGTELNEICSIQFTSGFDSRPEVDDELCNTLQVSYESVQPRNIAPHLYIVLSILYTIMYAYHSTSKQSTLKMHDNKQGIQSFIFRVDTYL